MVPHDRPVLSGRTKHQWQHRMGTLFIGVHNCWQGGSKKATALGLGAFLAKISIKSAYRLVPVHSSDHLMLGFWWQNNVHLDATLLFGLQSAPKVFNALADTLEWYFHYRSVTHSDHYLDDFMTMALPASLTCARNLRVIHEVSATLRVPLAEDKCEGPSEMLTFLGIDIDTQEKVLQLPQEKH